MAMRGDPVTLGERSHPLDKIKHVVIVIQENRSFNNLFYGFPGAKTVTFGYDSKNEKIALKPIGLSTNWDLEHNSHGFYAACNGTGEKYRARDCRMNGFDNETWTCARRVTPSARSNIPPYSYVPHARRRRTFRWASNTC